MHPPGSGNPEGMDPRSTFWNLSNHRLATAWSTAQQRAARAWRGVEHVLRDHPFPAVDPQASAAVLPLLADRVVADLLAQGAQPGDPVLVQGEFGLVVALVPRLRSAGLLPLHATSNRDAVEEAQPDGSVVLAHTFRFVRFREYP